MCGTLTLILAAIPAGVAQADKIKHRGELLGIPGSQVKFSVVKHRGELTLIRNLVLKGIPVTCSDGGGGPVDLSPPNHELDGNQFTIKGSVRGPGISSGSARTAGRFRGGGRRAAGTVKVAYKLDTGAGCGTGGKLRWKSAKG